MTNIDREHLDYYSGIKEIKEVFIEFINKIPFYGAAVLCLDDPCISDILPKIKKRKITYGLTSRADIHAREISTKGLVSRFNVCTKNEALGEIKLSLPGLHNVSNALAAITIALELEISFSVISDALGSFSGVQRRMQVKGEKRNILVMDDYGHHPTEVRATLSALRNGWPERRIVVMFQPHRYTRTQALFKEFCTAFHEADVLLLTDIYPAGESPIKGVSSKLLMQGIMEHESRHVYLVPDIADLPQAVMGMLSDGDLVLTLGAGNIRRAGEELVKRLENGA